MVSYLYSNQWLKICCRNPPRVWPKPSSTANSRCQSLFSMINQTNLFLIQIICNKLLIPRTPPQHLICMFLNHKHQFLFTRSLLCLNTLHLTQSLMKNYSL